jgi:hypothetical protein
MPTRSSAKPAPRAARQFGAPTPCRIGDNLGLRQGGAARPSWGGPSGSVVISFQEPSEETAALRGRILALVEEYHALAHAPKAFEAGASPVPVSGRIYDASDMRSLVDSALDFWLTTGRFNDAFEAKLAQRLGARTP